MNINLLKWSQVDYVCQHFLPLLSPYTLPNSIDTGVVCRQWNCHWSLKFLAKLVQHACYSPTCLCLSHYSLLITKGRSHSAVMAAFQDTQVNITRETIWCSIGELSLHWLLCQPEGAPVEATLHYSEHPTTCCLCSIHLRYDEQIDTSIAWTIPNIGHYLQLLEDLMY